MGLFPLVGVLSLEPVWTYDRPMEHSSPSGQLRMDQGRMARQRIPSVSDATVAKPATSGLGPFDLWASGRTELAIR